MEKIDAYSRSPYPAWGFAAALGLAPLYKPIEISKMRSYPSTMQGSVFAAFTALGGFFCYDNDVQDGAAVVAVWSTLYALANWKRAMFNLKMGPKVLLGLSLVNGGAYGAQVLGLFPKSKAVPQVVL